MIGYPQRVEQCCVCSRIVLGLAGQDTFLEAHFLRRDNSDVGVVEAGISGPCHLRCLLSSGYGEFWASRIREYYSIPHSARIMRFTLESLVCYSKYAKSIIIARVDGWLLSVYSGSLDALLFEEGEYVVFKDTAQVCVPSGAFAAVELGHDKNTDLVLFFNRLGIFDDLYWKGMADGTFAKIMETEIAANGLDLLVKLEYPVRVYKTDYLLACAVLGKKIS